MFRLWRTFALSLKRAAVAGAFAAAVLATTHSADAVVVERIVAVVGDKPILLSELRHRSKPFLLQVMQSVPAGAQQAAAQSQILKDMLEKMVDEELESQAATRANITVTSQEVENAFDNIAAAQGVTKDALFKAARARNGLSDQDYRDEMRRQILEGKMIQLRVKGRVRITEEDVKTMYDRVVREERKIRDYHPAWVVLRLLPGASTQAIAERKAQAEEIAERARKGEDFAKLAAAYSDDAATRDAGGDIGVRSPNGSPQTQGGKASVLAPELEAAVMPLEPGEVAAPLVVGQAIVVMKLLSRQPSRYTGLKEARAEMIQRLQAEIMDKAKRKWLEELRRRTHVETRL
ncbi:MAG: SurA N-terminal domain-containing protein [Polyangiaceae bacterium]|nr:SurA N-terminal domain-containing protein [Polyangiaceae bacterium]